jgi:branched-chain amino acid transport system substrate-binding protein
VSYEPADPTIDSQVVQLKASGADLFYNVTIPKFAAQSIKKMAEIGWKPVHVLNNVAASVGGTLKPAGFENSQDIISSAYFKDPADPQWKDDPAMKEYFAFLDKYLPDASKDDGIPAYGYIVAQAIVKVLEQAGDNLTRENIMKEAANLKNFEISMFLPGVKANTSPTDFFPIEQMQLMKFKGDKFDLFGPMIDGTLSGS